MTGTDLYVNKPHCAAAVLCGLFTHKSVRSYLNHLVQFFHVSKFIKGLTMARSYSRNM